jgi:PAS domain-containing protein
LLEESDLRLLIDLAPTAVLLLRRGDRNRPAPVVQLTNRAFTELAGIAPEAVAGRSLRTLRSLFEGDETFARLTTAAQVGEPFVGRLRLRMATGRTMTLGVRAQGLRQRPEHYAQRQSFWPLATSILASPPECRTQGVGPSR